MLNKKFLTKLLNKSFRRTTIARNYKYVESEDLKLKAYATYVVDKYNNDRDKAFVDVKAANYGYSPLEVLAYVAKDGSIKSAFFEFNSVSHFLKKRDNASAVEVVICILSELAKENKKSIVCFDIDKIDAYLKKLEKEYLKTVEELKKLKEEDEKEEDYDANKEIHKEVDS